MTIRPEPDAAAVSCRTSLTPTPARPTGGLLTRILPILVAVLVTVPVTVALVVVPGAAVLVTGPASALASAHVAVPDRTTAALARVPASGLPFDPAPLGGRCGDPAGAWLGLRWPTTLRWRFNADSVPAYLADSGRSAVLTSISTAAHTVATGANDCGLPTDLTMSQRYQGDTDHAAGVTTSGGCGPRDGQNVVSFGTLPLGLLAVTCVWWEGKAENTRSVEADILIDESAGTFFLTPPAECRSRWDLESIVTHEFGHVFGLGHVPYAQHRALTMSDGIPECTTAYRGLGLGDYLTLRGHYGPPAGQ